MFNFLGAIASLLPGYVEGRRQAIQDNWSDLSNYNQVRSGQLGNLFTEATWDDRLRQMNDATVNSGFNTLMNNWNTFLYGRSMPARVAQADAGNWYAPWESMLNHQAMIRASQYALNNPSVHFPAAQQYPLNPAPSFGGQNG